MVRGRIWPFDCSVQWGSSRNNLVSSWGWQSLLLLPLEPREDDFKSLSKPVEALPVESLRVSIHVCVLGTWLTLSSSPVSCVFPQAECLLRTTSPSLGLEGGVGTSLCEHCSRKQATSSFSAKKSLQLILLIARLHSTMDNEIHTPELLLRPFCKYLLWACFLLLWVLVRIQLLLCLLGMSCGLFHCLNKYKHPLCASALASRCWVIWAEQPCHYCFIWEWDLKAGFW